MTTVDITNLTISFVLNLWTTKVYQLHRYLAIVADFVQFNTVITMCGIYKCKREYAYKYMFYGSELDSNLTK